MGIFRNLVAATLTAGAAYSLGQTSDQPLAGCPGEHPGRQHRLESLAKQGDSRMVYSAAGHAVNAAVAKFGLEGQFSQAEIEKAYRETYEFLKWKLGGPAPAAAQWLSAGYQHFCKGYSDEGAAILLGLIKNGSNPQLIIPDWVFLALPTLFPTIFWTATAEEIMMEFWKISGCDEEFIRNSPMAGWAIQMCNYVKEKNMGAVRAVAGAFPKKFDVDNRLVEMAIAAKKAPAPVGFPGAGNPPVKDVPPGANPGDITSPTGDTRPGSGGTPPRSDHEARIAALEREVAELKRIIAEMRAGGARGGATPGGLTPVTTGYASVRLRRSVYNSKLTVRVNGTVISTFNSSGFLDLNPMLKTGAENRIEFEWDKPNTSGAEGVSLEVQTPGSTEWLEVFSFSAKDDRLKDSFVVPFVGKAAK